MTFTAIYINVFDFKTQNDLYLQIHYLKLWDLHLQYLPLMLKLRDLRLVGIILTKKSDLNLWPKAN